MARDVKFDIIARDKASGPTLRAAGAAEVLHNRLKRLEGGFPPILAGAAALGPALIPVLATASAAAVGMGVALGSAGSALGVFGAVTKTAFGEVKDASDKTKDLRDKIRLLQEEAKIAPTSALSDKYMKQVSKATLEYNARLSELPPTTRNVVRAYDKMTGSWQAFVDKNKPAVYGVMTSGFDAISRHVGDLQPLFDTGAKFAGRWVNSITGWVDKGGLSRVVAFLDGNAGPALKRLETIFRNLAKVGGNLMDAAVFSKSGGLLGFLERGSGALAKWSSGNGLTRLMDYLDKNGPKVASTAKDFAGAVIQIGQAVTPLAPVSLALADGLAKIVAAIPPDVLTVMVGLYLGLSVGIRAVAAATRLWGIAQVILDAALDANPIGLVVLGILALVGVFILAKAHAKQIAQAVLDLWNMLKDGARTAISFVLGMISKFLGGLSSLVGALGHLPGPLGAPFRAAKGEIDKAKGAVDALQNTINATHGKTVSVRMVVTQTGAQKVQREIDNISGHAVSIQVGLIRGVGVRGFASGTPSAPRGMALVGEQGPELVHFRGGERVDTAAATRTTLAARSHPTVNYNITVNGALDPAETGKQIQKMLLRLKRTNGGLALGLA